MGKLYVVATPIGNLQDITVRALEVLKTVDMIAAEDTRHSRKLLDHYHIGTKLTSLYGDNEEEKSKKILVWLEEGKSIALISDAGTPLISDPGEYLVSQAMKQGHTIITVPGACALIAALSISGLSTKQFRFEGFLPHKGKSRRDRLECLWDDTSTLIFYESCHRIENFFELAVSVFGKERPAVFARELTKQYETVRADTLGALSEWVIAHEDQQRGEYVVLIAGAQEKQKQGAIEVHQILKVLCRHLSTKEAAKIAGEITGLSQRELYQRLLDLKEIV